MNVHDEIGRLVPNLGALQSAITLANIGDRDSYRKTAYRLELLPYHLGCTLAALDKAFIQQENIIRSIDLNQFRRNTDYSVPDDERDRLGYEIDAFLDAATRTQDSLWPYLQHRHNQSLPYSFRKLVAKVDTRKISFGETIDNAISTYWANSGEHLRSYRDLSQHYVVLPSNAHVIVTNGCIESFFMPLPSNPEATQPLLLEYNNESPNACPYMIDAFSHLTRFIRDVIRELLGSDIREPRGVVCHMFKEGGFGTPLRTGKIMTGILLHELVDSIATERDVIVRDTK